MRHHANIGRRDLHHFVRVTALSKYLHDITRASGAIFASALTLQLAALAELRVRNHFPPTPRVTRTAGTVCSCLASQASDAAMPLDVSAFNCEVLLLVVCVE